jgi:hypothetical protein
MDTSRVKLAVKLAIPAVMLGIVVWYFWWFAQAVLLPVLPAGTKEATGLLPAGVTYLSLGLMTLKVIPPYNRWRILLDFLSGLALMIYLLYAANSGTIALDAGLFVIMIWSLWANWDQHKPVTATWRQWRDALLVMAVCAAFGLLVGWLWPVNEKTQYQGWYWAYIGLAGGGVLTVAITALETRVIPGDHWLYRVVYGFGCALLWVSFLGEYNYPRLVLNSSLVALTYGPLVLKVLRWK